MPFVLRPRFVYTVFFVFVLDMRLIKVPAVGASPVAQIHTLTGAEAMQGVNRSSRFLHI